MYKYVCKISYILTVSEHIEINLKKGTNHFRARFPTVNLAYKYFVTISPSSI